MKKILILASVAAIGLGSVAATDAEARSRRGAAVAAGVIGGLAAGALIAGAANAYNAPSYSYGYGAPAYGYGAPAYGYGAPVGYGYAYEPAPVVSYRSRRVVSDYGYAPVSGYGYDYGYAPPTGRVVRGGVYGAPRSYGYGPAYGYGYDY